jgi:hypothetical protein
MRSIILSFLRGVGGFGALDACAIGCGSLSASGSSERSMSSKSRTSFCVSQPLMPPEPSALA